MNRLVTIGVAALALGALALSACGGDDDDSKTATKDDATQAATAKTGENKTSSGTTVAAEPTKKDGDAQVTGSGADALRKLAKDLSTKTYQVSYDFTQVEADKKTTKSTITIAQKPPKSATSGQDLTTGTTFVFFSDGSASYTCFKETAGAGQCFKRKLDAAPLGNFLSLDTLLKSLSDDINVTSAGSRTIAGVDSQCFNGKGKEFGGEGVACFSKKDGIVTLVDTKSEDGSTERIEAKKASNSVDESLFAVPTGYTVTSQ